MLVSHMMWSGKAESCARQSGNGPFLAGCMCAGSISTATDKGILLDMEASIERSWFIRLDSYRYWENFLGRHDLEYGHFGENLTVDGLSDSEVCIGDRYRIGSAVFEVTQPRVTCYRLGIRMNNSQMPALLVSHRRPGFYFRTIEEGEIGAGDAI